MKKERKRKKAKKSAEQPIVKVETGETLAEEICALQLFSEELGGKWRMRVLWALHDGSGCRYSLVKNRIPGITDMMLTQSLKELQHSGYVSREQFPRIAAPGGVSNYRSGKNIAAPSFQCDSVGKGKQADVPFGIPAVRRCAAVRKTVRSLRAFFAFFPVGAFQNGNYALQ